MGEPLSQTATTQHRPTTDASESAKPVMSDITKPKAKDLAQLRQELQIPDEKELLQIKKEEAQERERREVAQEPLNMKHYNWKGPSVLKKKDISQQQQPGGAMRGS